MKNIDLERRQYYGRNRRNPVQGNEWRTDTSLEGVMSEEKMLASLNRYVRIAAQEMKRTDQAQYEM
ncbi:hypothetical protein, partial [Porphyromonas gingivalis]|uniref:hypothetical protein n=1 Tax=Porphyromonas gingivalis TaxID=837 RepID=UPI00197D3E80